MEESEAFTVQRLEALAELAQLRQVPLPTLMQQLGLKSPAEDYSHIIRLTPTGRVTIETLHLNRDGVVNLRRILFLVGLHPPEETDNPLR
jgi:hypothetical protein